VSPGSTLRRWTGAAIGGGAFALAVLVLLGVLISPRFAVPRFGGDRIFSIRRIIECGIWGVPVRGLVVFRSSDQVVSGVPDAVFCEPDQVGDCAYQAGRSGPAGSFDFRVSFDFVTVNGVKTEGAEEKVLVVSAPGCKRQELHVRDRRAPYQVVLECPERSRGRPPAPPLSVGAVSGRVTTRSLQ
jgi:hypothetical protein